MKHEEVPGFKELREELKDARIVLVRASNEKEREEAQKRVKELRQSIARAMYEDRERRRVKW